MSYGLSNDPLLVPGQLDIATGHHENTHSPVASVPEEPDNESFKESTDFEWVADGINSREKGAIGIEFDGRRLVVIGSHVARSGMRAVDHALITKYDEFPDSESLSRRLRGFVHRNHPEVHLVLSTPRAVVRHFTLPPVPQRQRESAAIWQGQKLIPFSLKDGAALYGLDFVPVADKGLKATLVAVPTEDAASVLDALTILGWNLASVSLVGTQHADSNSDARLGHVTAVVSWSDSRGCFAVYNRRQLVFHYDLGPMPKTPRGLEAAMTAETAPHWQRWIDSLGVTVSDALDFHLNINPSIPPSRLTLYGLPVEASPLLTEWNNRFPEGVAIGDPLDDCRDNLPEGVLNWLSPHPGVIAPVLAAMHHGVSVDLTPASVRKRRSLYRRERILRSVCILSFAVCAAWTGLIWSHISGHRAEGDRSRAAMEQLQSSPVNVRLDEAIAAASGNQLLANTIASPSVDWMPWFRTILATLPENAHLNHADMAYRGDKNTVVAHLEGSLSPAATANSMIYRDWFDRMRPLTLEAPTLVNERSLDVAGTTHSAFTVELVAPKSLAISTGGRE